MLKTISLLLIILSLSGCAGYVDNQDGVLLNTGNECIELLTVPVCPGEPDVIIVQ